MTCDYVTCLKGFGKMPFWRDKLISFLEQEDNIFGLEAGWETALL